MLKQHADAAHLLAFNYVQLIVLCYNGNTFELIGNIMPEKIKPRDKPHYVNNRDFSYAVVDYVTQANAAKEAGSAIRRKEQTHKMAEANKAFAHFRY